MNPNAYQNNIVQSNNSLSSDNDNSHNFTNQELIKSKPVSLIPLQVKKKSLKFNSINSIDQRSSEHLFNLPVPIQTKNIIIQSSSANNHNHYLRSFNQQAMKNSISKLNRINSNQQHNQPADIFMRPKTMIEIQKQYQMTSEILKHKLPQTILEFIVSKAKLKNQLLKSTKFTQTGKKLSKLGISKKLQLKYHKIKCNICQIQHPQKQFQKFSKTCSHTFCNSCLHQYVIYKINAFIAVQCPNEECQEIFDQDSQLYIQLPLDVRKKYKKLLQYQMMKEHPNRKMCPQEKCQGYIEINEFIDTVCNLCKNRYCPKCLLKQHEGDCDNQHLQFFQETLHYRQCNKCKNIIEKSMGCIHMTCRCGYQFCYLCGEKWRHSHVCTNPQQQPIPTQRVECCCCQIEICDCEICCERCCDHFCGILDDICCCCHDCECDCCSCDECETNCCDCCLGMLMLKSLIFIGFICFIFPLYIAYITVMGIVWIFITILIGSTMYTVEYIGELEEWIFFLSIVFYPFTMWIGIFLAFRQIFLEAFVSNMAEIGHDVWEGFTQSIQCQ